MSCELSFRPASPPRPGAAAALRLLTRLTLTLSVCLFLSACQTIRPRTDKHASWSLQTAALQDNDSLYAEAFARHPGLTGFRILTYGPEALLARASIVDNARHTLDLQYYIFDPDKVGHTLTQRLLEAADRGVRVRLLLDDNNQAKDRPLIILSSHPNIEVRVFNPFRHRARWLRYPQYLTDLSRVNRRMHNKVIISDNRLAILGGRNIGDNYFDISESDNFRDFDLLMAGPLSQDASRAFDEYWNSSWAVPSEDLARSPVTAEEYKAFRTVHDAWVLDAPSDKAKYESLRDEYTRTVLERPEDLVWASGTLFWDPPGKMEGSTGELSPVARRLSEEMKACSRSCLIEAGYFIPGEDGMQRLLELRRRGVEVDLLTSALEASDQPLVYSAYRRYRKDLLRAGVDIHEYKLHAKVPPAKKRWFHPRRSPSSLHSKVLVFDHAKVWVGSFNHDSRSVHYNTEIAALIDSPELAEQMSALIYEGFRKEASWQVTLEEKAGVDRLQWHGEKEGESATLSKEPSRSWWQRFRARVYSLLPGIEHLL